MAEPPGTRKRTPRVPSNALFERIVPIALALMALALIAVIVIAAAGLVNAIR